MGWSRNSVSFSLSRSSSARMSFTFSFSSRRDISSLCDSGGTSDFLSSVALWVFVAESAEAPLALGVACVSTVFRFLSVNKSGCFLNFLTTSRTILAEPSLFERFFLRLRESSGIGFASSCIDMLLVLVRMRSVLRVEGASLLLAPTAMLLLLRRKSCLDMP